MTTFFGRILATALLGQLQGGPIQGTVVDEQRKPVAGAAVVFFAPAPPEGKVDPVTVQTTTDAAGRFHLTSPPLGRQAMNGVNMWAHRPGSAITAAVARDRPPIDLVLREPAPRAVMVVGPDGRPVAGAIIAPRVISVADGRSIAEMPAALASSLAVTTGREGKAALDYLSASDQLVAVRITAEPIGSQDLVLVELRSRERQAATITINLRPTSRLTGRVRNRAGQPVAGQTVEVWSKGGDRLVGGEWLVPSVVVFKNGRIQTAADGTFQTPDKLLVGSPYRVVVVAPGMEPILSEWITIEERPRVLLPMTQRPLRTIGGRVVDRQGKPLANIEVFQSGDGPERTATRTDRDGRFTLGGFRQGPVFLFARGNGFRFFGRLVKPGEHDLAVELTRTGERPPREMRMLPEPIPWAESRALARRVIEPCWDAAVARKDQNAADRALIHLAEADPAAALQKLEANEPAIGPTQRRMIERMAAVAMVRTEPVRAEELVGAIEAPANRAAALVQAVDALPPDARDRKLALLARAEIDARAAGTPFSLAEVAERWHELGEEEKAKGLFAEGIRLGNDIPPRRALFAARLAHVDLPAALAIAKELKFPGTGGWSTNRVFWNIAQHLAAENPAEAERVLRSVPQEPGRLWLPLAITWKMATTDPARARRLVDEAQRFDDHPEAYLFLALGLKARDPAAADAAFQKGIQGIDRLMKERVEYSAMRGGRGVLLPLVEQIDPALVPEVFWRAVATRPPIGNPRSRRDRLLVELVMLLGWYDRDVAAALFEPIRVAMEQTDDLDLAGRAIEFQGWSILDPRAAAARLEQVPIATGPGANTARELVAVILGLSFQDRWRRVWSDYTEMRDLLGRGTERDVPPSE